MNCAVVVIADHDPVTHRIRLAGELVTKTLTAEGFHVISLFGENATLAHVFVALLEANLVDARPVRLGFFGAHGSELGLHEAPADDGLEPLLLELQTCKQFDGAILIMCACLESGLFPQAVTESLGSVRAVVGYRRQMVIPEETVFAKYDEAVSVFNQILLKHVTSLIEGNTVDLVLDAVKLAWEKAATYKTLGADFAFCCQLNRGRLSAWGDRSATL